MQLSLTQKQAVRSMRKVNSAISVARMFGISRARVYQICSDRPETWRDTKGKVLLVPEQADQHLPKRLKHRLTRKARQEIISSKLSDAKLAKKYDVSVYAIARVRYALGTVLRFNGGLKGGRKHVDLTAGTDLMR